MNSISTTITLEESTTDEITSQNPELDVIIRGCLANDRSAQEKLYKRYYGKMMGTCLRYLKNEDDALDVLNTGFLKVFQNLSSYSGKGSFDGWVYLIIRNAIIDQLRKRLKYREESLEENHNNMYQVQSGVLEQLYAEDLLKLLQKLPETTRLVFNLFAIDGFKHEEISTMLKISQGTSKWHVSEARRILKESLEHNKSVKP